MSAGRSPRRRGLARPAPAPRSAQNRRWHPLAPADDEAAAGRTPPTRAPDLLREPAMQPTDPSAPAAFDPSWLLSPIALVVALLAAYVALGYARHARADHRLGIGGRHFALLIGKAILALGSGLWAASVLAVSSEPLVHAFDYRPTVLVLLWLAAVAIAAGTIAPAARRPGALTVIAGGLWFGIGLASLQVALADAIAPPETGIASTPIEWLLAWLAATVGGTASLWIVFRAAGRHGSRRHVLRWTAAAVVAVTVTAVQSLVLAGATTPEVLGASAWVGIPSAFACGVAALVVPVALGFGWMDLRQRSEARGASGSRHSGLRSEGEAARLPR